MWLPDGPSRKDLLPQILRGLSVDSAQLSSTLGTASSTESHLVHGQALPGSATINDWSSEKSESFSRWVLLDSLWPHGLQPARLFYLWHSPGKARILQWVAIPFSKGYSWPRDQTWISHIAGRLFTIWATREAQLIQTDIYKLCHFVPTPDNSKR